MIYNKYISATKKSFYGANLSKNGWIGAIEWLVYTSYLQAYHDTP